MAMLDYGALLRVDGKFVNKNADMFMEASDTGYVCKKATDKNGNEYDIDGNYFVYAGDEHFLLVFYKGTYKIISDERILYSSWRMPFNSETHYFDNLPNVKISRLSPYFNAVPMESWGKWSDFVKENWQNATGNEKLSELADGVKMYKRFKRHAKCVARVNRHGGVYKTRPYRFLAEWDYNNHHYEVIFGYGIDNSDETWDAIKNKAYDFRNDEKEIIDAWFDITEEE